MFVLADVGSYACRSFVVSQGLSEFARRGPKKPPPPVIQGAETMVALANPRLTDKQAVVVWIAHWLGIPKQRLAERYLGDRRRIYEVVMFQKHHRAYDDARRIYRALWPGRVARTDFSEHKRKARWTVPGQMDLFE